MFDSLLCYATVYYYYNKLLVWSHYILKMHRIADTIELEETTLSESSSRARGLSRADAIYCYHGSSSILYHTCTRPTCISGHCHWDGTKIPRLDMGFLKEVLYALWIFYFCWRTTLTLPYPISTPGAFVRLNNFFGPRSFFKCENCPMKISHCTKALLPQKIRKKPMHEKPSIQLQSMIARAYKCCISAAFQ